MTETAEIYSLVGPEQRVNGGGETLNPVGVSLAMVFSPPWEKCWSYDV